MSTTPTRVAWRSKQGITTVDLPAAQEAGAITSTAITPSEAEQQLAKVMRAASVERQQGPRRSWTFGLSSPLAYFWSEASSSASGSSNSPAPLPVTPSPTSSPTPSKAVSPPLPEPPPSYQSLHPRSPTQSTDDGWQEAPTLSSSVTRPRRLALKGSFGGRKRTGEKSRTPRDSRTRHVIQSRTAPPDAGHPGSIAKHGRAEPQSWDDDDDDLEDRLDRLNVQVQSLVVEGSLALVRLPASLSRRSRSGEVRSKLGWRRLVNASEPY